MKYGKSVFIYWWVQRLEEATHLFWGDTRPMVEDS